MHRVSGQCRAAIKPERKPSTWTRPTKERTHSGPWPYAEHGTRARYQGNATLQGCRCRPCVEANYAYQKSYRAKRGA